MANMSLTKVKISEQDPAVRNHNFLEVSLGYTAEEAMEEASRCLGTDGERLYFLAQESDPSQGLYAASVEDFGQAGGLQRLGG